MSRAGLRYALIFFGLLAYSYWNPSWEKIFRHSIYILMLLTVGLTLYSGLSYLWDNRKIITRL